MQETEKQKTRQRQKRKRMTVATNRLMQKTKIMRERGSEELTRKTSSCPFSQTTNKMRKRSTLCVSVREGVGT